MAVTHPLARAGVVAIYVAVFWGALPAGLWWLGTTVDMSMGWPRRTYMTVGGPVMGVGAALIAWSMLALWRRGRGLAVSALPPEKLVETGPYALCRHPIYLGFNLLVLGVGLFTGSRGVWAAVAPAFLFAWWGYAAVEERGLSQRFPEAYPDYRDRVGMLPWLSRRNVDRLFGKRPASGGDK